MLMTGALSVVEPGSPIQLVLAILVMLAFTLITLKLAPYRHKSDDWTTFLVSLVITGNTLAGFVLLMDKDNSPHNFNPKNIEALLLFMNITVLVLQVLNMILIKWGLWDIMSKKPCCRKVQRVCGASPDSATRGPINKVVPTRPEGSTAPASTEDENQAEVQRLMSFHANSERQFKEMQTKRYQRSSINVQNRVAARRKVRQTKALTKAAVFAGIDETATQIVLSAMDYERYENGAIICEEGAEADRFYIIVAGQCKATLGSGPRSVHVGDLGALDVMGENALIVDEEGEGGASSRVRSATITVVSDVVQTLELHRVEFERLVERGIIGQEVLQRMRAMQKDRREIREAVNPRQQKQQEEKEDVFGSDNDRDEDAARLSLSVLPSPAPPGCPPPLGENKRRNDE